MKDFRFNYIITIHNKEDLIERVLLGVINSWREGSFVYPVLDGCTDQTEAIVDRVAKAHPQVPIVKIYAPDVHEIKSINIALKTVPQDQNGCNIILQDDVILTETDLEKKVKALYDHIGYEKVGCVAFRHGANARLDHVKKELREIDLRESDYGIGTTSFSLPAGHIVERLIGVRSPECMSCELISKIGIMDETLAPYTYDNHDISIRSYRAGFRNFVYAISFESELKWGGTRTNPHSQYGIILHRNCQYLYHKYFDFFKTFEKSLEYKRLRAQIPFVLPETKVSKELEVAAAHQFQSRQKQLYGTRAYYISKYIKIPVKYLLELYQRALYMFAK